MKSPKISGENLKHQKHKPGRSMFADTNGDLLEGGNLEEKQIRDAIVRFAALQAESSGTPPQFDLGEGSEHLDRGAIIYEMEHRTERGMGFLDRFLLDERKRNQQRSAEMSLHRIGLVVSKIGEELRSRLGRAWGA